MLPLVSIVIPSYNRVGVISQTIESILRQSYSSWEAIIVDDGSEDGSQEVIRAYVEQSSKIRFYERGREPKGAPTCRNIGLEKSKGEYIIFLDSDDLLADHCLKGRISDFHEYHEFDFLVYGMQFFTHQPGDHERVWLQHFHNGYLSGFLLQSQWAITGPIWKRNSLLKLGGFDEQLLSWQDGDLHRRALIQGLNFKVFNKVDAYCRRNPNTPRIGKYDHKLEYILSRRYQLDKIWTMLDQAKLVTETRRNIMAGQYVTLCRILIEKEEESLSMKVWQEAYQRKIVKRFTYNLINIYFFLRKKSTNTLWVRCIKKIFQFILPKYVIWYG